jgi:hypothetical protein
MAAKYNFILGSPFREIVWRQLGAGTIVPMETQAVRIIVVETGVAAPQNKASGSTT